MDYYESLAREYMGVEAESSYYGFNYHNITKDDMKNGDGLRVVLWMAGCTHACPGCQNPITWDGNDGIPFEADAKAELFAELKKDWIEGLTLSGGDPLFPKSRKGIANLISDVRKAMPEKNIWLYTGYTLKYSDADGWYFEDEVIDDKFSFPAFKDVDYIVDGRFDAKVRQSDITLGKKVPWRGSSNQRIIDVKRTISTGRIVEKEV